MKGNSSARRVDFLRYSDDPNEVPELLAGVVLGIPADDAGEQLLRREFLTNRPPATGANSKLWEQRLKDSYVELTSHTSNEVFRTYGKELEVGAGTLSGSVSMNYDKKLEVRGTWKVTDQASLWRYDGGRFSEIDSTLPAPRITGLQLNVPRFSALALPGTPAHMKSLKPVEPFYLDTATTNGGAVDRKRLRGEWEADSGSERGRVDWFLGGDAVWSQPGVSLADADQATAIEAELAGATRAASHFNNEE